MIKESKDLYYFAEDFDDLEYLNRIYYLNESIASNIISAGKTLKGVIVPSIKKVARPGLNVIKGGSKHLKSGLFSKNPAIKYGTTLSTLSVGGKIAHDTLDKMGVSDTNDFKRASLLAKNAVPYAVNTAFEIYGLIPNINNALRSVSNISNTISIYESEILEEIEKNANSDNFNLNIENNLNAIIDSKWKEVYNDINKEFNSIKATMDETNNKKTEIDPMNNKKLYILANTINKLEKQIDYINFNNGYTPTIKNAMMRYLNPIVSKKHFNK